MAFAEWPAKRARHRPQAQGKIVHWVDDEGSKRISLPSYNLNLPPWLNRGILKTLKYPKDSRAKFSYGYSSNPNHRYPLKSSSRRKDFQHHLNESVSRNKGSFNGNPA